MSYGRNLCYIYSDGEQMHFMTDGMVRVSENHINALLYKLLLLGRREELGRRLREGKAVWQKPMYHPNELEVYPDEMPTDHPEYARLVGWMDSREDDILRALMQEQPVNPPAKEKTP